MIRPALWEGSSTGMAYVGGQTNQSMESIDFLQDSNLLRMFEQQSYQGCRMVPLDD